MVRGISFNGISFAHQLRCPILVTRKAFSDNMTDPLTHMQLLIKERKQRDQDKAVNEEPLESGSFAGIVIEKLCAWFGNRKVLKDISLTIEPEKEIGRA